MALALVVHVPVGSAPTPPVAYELQLLAVVAIAAADVGFQHRFRGMQ